MHSTQIAYTVAFNEGQGDGLNIIAVQYGYYI